MSQTEVIAATNFIRNMILDQRKAGDTRKIITRFPPEPNGFLHIGHAKSICLNFGLAEEFDGQCNLRFDDTNPEKESQEFIDAIKEDVQWLGYQWHGEVLYASDYFEQLYAWAVHLIEEGKAFVCELSAEQMREYRGTLTEPGTNSPYRERSIEENLAEFAKMRAGDYPDGAKVLRAKIDMASPNINLRDPILYRIRHQTHHQTGDAWCIYPSYDFTHGQSDALEGITHSLCTLEFEDHRPLYEWFLDNLPVPAKPVQTEFARLNLNYTVTSKRRLKLLVDEGVVDGWNDPRMPTISGLRRRGYTPASIRNFCQMLGVNRAGGLVDINMLNFALRQDLETNAKRAMAVLKPLKITLTNWPEGKVEMLSLPNHQQRPELGNREVPFSGELYIEQEDFMQNPPSKFFRLAPDKEVRLRNAWVIKCEEVMTNEAGEVVELRCTYDPDTLGKNPEGRRVRGVIHWVSAEQAVKAEVRMYDNLFTVEEPDADKETDFLTHINPKSLEVVEAFVEPSLAAAQPEESFQFERVGYFVADRHDHSIDKPVFNLTVGLKDGWAREQKKGK